MLRFYGETQRCFAKTMSPSNVTVPQHMGRKKTVIKPPVARNESNSEFAGETEQVRLLAVTVRKARVAAAAAGLSLGGYISSRLDAVMEKEIPGLLQSMGIQPRD